MTRQAQPATFIVKLRSRPGIDSTKELRAVLKTLLRRYGLACVAVHEQVPDHPLDGTTKEMSTND